MKDLKIVSLLQNGASFDANTYTITDNLDAYIICKDSLVSIRVAPVMCGMHNEVSTNILSDKKQMDKEFLEFIENIEEDFIVHSYLICRYQEYLYPFVYDDVINDFTIMVRWVYKNLNVDKKINLVIFSFSFIVNKIVIYRNDISVTVDYYDNVHNEPYDTRTFYFDDYNFEDEL